MELVLSLPNVDFRHHIHGSSFAVNLRAHTWGLCDVASTTTSGRKVAVYRLALDAFANNSAIGVNVGVGPDVASACI
jgi:hypothetical protein